MPLWHESCTSLQRSAWLGGGLLFVSMIVAAEDLSRLPDPTRPYTGADAPPAPPLAREAATGPELQSTLISQNLRRATISGRSYKPGDRIDGAVVADIQAYEVTLRQNGKETRLRLLPRLIKEPRILDRKTGKDG